MITAFLMIIQRSEAQESSKQPKNQTETLWQKKKNILPEQCGTVINTKCALQDSGVLNADEDLDALVASQKS